MHRNLRTYLFKTVTDGIDNKLDIIIEIISKSEDTID